MGLRKMGMSKRIAPLAVTLLAALPAVARAAEEHGGGGMPQLRFDDPAVIAQIVWLFIIFGLLYFIMSNIALPRVAEVLEERRLRIEADLGVAQDAKARADAALAEHQAATARARAEAQSAIASAVAAAQAEAGAKADALNAKLAAQVEAAERRIDAARASAMGALRQVSADTAESLITKLIGSADRAVVDAAVGRELSSRGRA
jgi:F-type H+-transporting ATPase subunit b